MEFIDQLKPLIDWLQANPNWAGFTVFLISLSESLAVIGLLIPGTVVMTAIGTLIGAGIIPAWQTVAWAVAGAIVGDSVSYRLGYHFTDHLKEIWPFRRYPQILNNGEKFFTTHGGKSVFLGRFVGPIRPIIPVIAGMMQMKPRHFLLSNVASAVLWAVFYMLPGYLIGAASQELDPKATTHFIVVVVAILLALWLIGWVLKIALYYLLVITDRLIARLWCQLAKTPSVRWLYNFLKAEKNPESHTQLIRVFLLLAFAVLLTYLCIGVHNDWFNDLNIATNNFCLSLHNPWLNSLMINFTFVGYRWVLLPMLGISLFYLIYRKDLRAASHLIAITGIALGLLALFKTFMVTARPDSPIASIGYSFPSSHTTLNIVLYGFLGTLIASAYQKPGRILTYVVVSTLCFFIVASRLYLGFHWLTDTLGAVLLAGICLLGTNISYYRGPTPTIRPNLLIILCVLTLIIGAGYRHHQHYIDYSEKLEPPPSTVIDFNDWWKKDNHSDPLYRTTRAGRPLEILNLEWASPLDTIESTLLTHGWKKIPKLTFISLVNRVASDSEEQEFPLFPAFYNGREPRLIVIKPLEDTNLLLVISLWQAKTIFADNTSPLWVGTISYQSIHNKFWHYRHPKRKQKLFTAATIMLEEDLGHFDWQRIDFPLTDRPKDIASRNEWQGGVLLIKSK